jgi:hypothetical protein
VSTLVEVEDVSGPSLYGYQFIAAGKPCKFKLAADYEVRSSSSRPLGNIRTDADSKFVTILGFYGLEYPAVSHKFVYYKGDPIKFPDLTSACLALSFVSYSMLRLIGVIQEGEQAIAAPFSSETESSEDELSENIGNTIRPFRGKPVEINGNV